MTVKRWKPDGSPMIPFNWHKSSPPPISDTNYDNRSYVFASDYEELEKRAKKLTLALRGANKYPEECTEGGACTSALAYEELLIERDALRTALGRTVTEVEAIMLGEHGGDWADHFGPLFAILEEAHAALARKEGT